MATKNVTYILGLRDQLSSKLGKVQGRVKGLAASMGSLQSGMIGAIGGAVVVAGFNKALKAWDKQAQAVAQVRQGLLTTGEGAGRTLDQLTKQAQDFQKKTIFGDETILAGVTAQLLTFTGITTEQFDRTQQAVLDVTTRIFGADAGAESLRSTAIQLGKALNDPIANLGALSRSGIQFSKDQKAVIKSLSESGRLAEAQSLILGELEKQYGGSAEAAAKAGAGPMKQFQNRLGDVVELIGKRLVPIMNELIKIFDSAMRFVMRNKDAFKQLFDILIIAIPALLSLKFAFVALNAVMNLNPISIIIVGVSLLIGYLVDLERKTGKVTATFKALWSGANAFLEGRNAADAYNKAWDSEMSKRSRKKTPGAATTPNLSGGLSTVPGLSSASNVGSGIGSGISSVSGSSPKVFNINIEKLVGIEEFITNNIKQGLTTMGDQVKRELLTALNDTQIISTQ